MNLTQNLSDSGYNILQDKESPKDILETYFSILKKRNEEKYGFYIFAMKFFAKLLVLFPGSMKGAGKALNFQYGGARIIDDVVDGDFPELRLDIVAYVEKRFRFIEALISHKDAERSSEPEDTLLREVFGIAKKAGREKEIGQSLKMIIESMQFDAKRIREFRNTGSAQILPEHELRKHFYDLDIIGTGIGMLVYLGSKDMEGDLKRVESIGTACRIEYNLHDFVEDLRAGIVNISAEDMGKYGITLNHLKQVTEAPIILLINKSDPSAILHQDINMYPLSIREWILSQIQAYNEQLDYFMHHQYGHFPLLTRIVFQQFYILSTRKFIRHLEKQLHTC